MPTTRHLAAVWFADIVGYSTLAARDEPAALNRIESLHELADQVSEESEGRIVKRSGDAVMAEFASTQAAVDAALELSDRFAREARGPGARLRIGVHVGDVVSAPDGDLYGDGVNVAARLQALAEPGQVVVSGDVQRQLRQRPEYRFAAHGARSLKGLADPVEVYSVVRADAPEPEAGRVGEKGTGRVAGPLLDRLPVSRRTAAVAGLILLVAATALVLSLRQLAPEAGSPGPEPSVSAVAVLPFAVRGSDELDYLGDGMVNLLSTKLDGAGDLRSVDPRALLSRVAEMEIDAADPAGARALAQRFGADWYVLGDILEVGGRIRLDAALYDGRDGSRVAEGTVEGPVDEIFSHVDGLATQILAGIRGGPAARVDRIAAVTTSSLPALKAFLRGESALRSEDFEGAVEAFQRAVASDTTFALGYYRLSIAAEWMLRAELAHAASQKAFLHADRLAERDRRLLEAFSAFRRGEVEAAEDLYRSLVVSYPDDVEAWLYLAELLFHHNPLRGRSPTEAREPFLRLLDLERDNTAALVHLARIAALEGREADLESHVSRYTELTPSGDRQYPMRSLRAFVLGGPEERARLIAEADRVAGATIALAIWDVALYAGDVRGGERLAEPLTAEWRGREERSLGYVLRAHFLLARGRWREAGDALDALERIDPAWGREYRALLTALPFVPSTRRELEAARTSLEGLDATAVPSREGPDLFLSAHDDLHPLFKEYLLGLLSVRLGEEGTATTHEERTKTIAAPSFVGSLPHDLAAGLRAHAHRAAGRPERALDALDRIRMEINYNGMIGSPIVSLAYERWTRAELLRALGREEEALDWYDHSFVTSIYEVVYLSLSRLRRAEIHEEAGERERAVREYTAFLELWTGADPEFRPMIEKAEEAVARLAPGRRDPVPGSLPRN